MFFFKQNNFRKHFKTHWNVKHCLIKSIKLSSTLSRDVIKLWIHKSKKLYKKTNFKKG